MKKVTLKKVALETWYRPNVVGMPDFDRYYTEVHAKKPAKK